MRIEKINLYVDDLRDCPKGFIVARNIDEAIKYIENGDVHILSLDHDLGEDEKGNLLPTGYDLVKYFREKGLRADKIYLHTDNGVGRDNMYHTLKAAQRRGFIDNDIEIYHYSITPNRYSGN
ncbi:cyclic-phosphate processing receiver domain-containing protein [Bacillus sp. B-jedd]|uniref:cyclic-phosphate processing receiver domain-containing protein n=1 Tax=Bacillus sp. B-jedd TaxID=1476857 RepID=UPI0005155960|nr:cyclic-phosphate processing receiver domain-containing protein [Bacillus sp. B-jedd]CEG26336.1 group-specific protein [Bacillus sp. B-jedd]